MKNNSDLIVNDIEYVLEEMGKVVDSINSAELLGDFVEMDDIENTITNVTSSFIREIMNEMIWPSMGKTQVSVNNKALTSYNVVVRHFKNEISYVDRNKVEAEEAVKAVFRRRGFLDG